MRELTLTCLGVRGRKTVNGFELNPRDSKGKLDNYSSKLTEGNSLCLYDNEHSVEEKRVD